MIWLLAELNRGGTGLKALGAYSDMDKNFLLYVVLKRQIQRRKEIVHQVDKMQL